MSVRLTWRAVNAAIADNILVYRSTVPIDADNPGTPIVTLPGSATTYDDTTVAIATVYYYRLAAVKGSDTLFSENLVHGHFPNNGPGPQKLRAGNWNHGYFGVVTPAEMLTVAEARALCGVAIGTVQTEANLTGWFKFAYKGKILFIPKVLLTTNVTWRQLYDLGLVYGTDDNGAVPPTASGTFAVNQKKLVTAKGFNFMVRLPKAANTPLNEFVTSTAQYVDGEWVDLMSRSFLNSNRTDVKPKWDDTANASILGGYTQHFWGTTRIIYFGGGSYVDVDGNVSPASASTSYGWSPVFELQY